MSMFRKQRLSDEQLQDLLGSLPQAKAPADLEDKLGQMIAAHSDHVPSLLGTLPLVPAPDDFDARLMEAIREGRRPVPPIPIAVSGGSSVNWLNHIMGWIGGSLAVVALAFLVNHGDDLLNGTFTSTEAPVALRPAGSVTSVKVAPPAPSVEAPKAVNRTAKAPQGEIAQAEPAPQAEAQPAPVRVRKAQSSTIEQQAAPVVRPEPRRTVTPRSTPETRTVPAPEVRNTPRSEPPVVQPSSAVTAPTEADTLSQGSTSAIPEEGIVNTGGDPGVDSSRPR